MEDQCCLEARVDIILDMMDLSGDGLVICPNSPQLPSIILNARSIQVEAVDQSCVRLGYKSWDSWKGLCARIKGCKQEGAEEVVLAASHEKENGTCSRNRSAHG